MWVGEGVLTGDAVVRSDFRRLALCFSCGGGEGGDLVLTGDPKPSPLEDVAGAPGGGRCPLTQSSVGGGMGRRNPGLSCPCSEQLSNSRSRTNFFLG